MPVSEFMHCIRLKSVIHHSLYTHRISRVETPFLKGDNQKSLKSFFETFFRFYIYSIMLPDIYIYIMVNQTDTENVRYGVSERKGVKFECFLVRNPPSGAYIREGCHSAMGYLFGALWRVVVCEF